MTSTYTPEQLAALSKEDQGPEVTGIVITFTVFALISVLLRFFSRLKFVGNVGLEDYAIAISMVRAVQGTYLSRSSLANVTAGLLYCNGSGTN